MSSQSRRLRYTDPLTGKYHIVFIPNTKREKLLSEFGKPVEVLVLFGSTKKAQRTLPITDGRRVIL